MCIAYRTYNTHTHATLAAAQHRRAYLFAIIARRRPAVCARARSAHALARDDDVRVCVRVRSPRTHLQNTHSHTPRTRAHSKNVSVWFWLSLKTNASHRRSEPTAAAALPAPIRSDPNQAARSSRTLRTLYIVRATSRIRAVATQTDRAFSPVHCSA